MMHGRRHAPGTVKIGFAMLAPAAPLIHVAAMLNLVSILIGLVALFFALPGIIPFLGWINWLVVPVALLGAGIGALSRGSAGRNLNILVLIVGVVRLSLGGGFL